MKNIIQYIAFVVLSTILISCNKDFLDKQPLDSLSTTGSLATTNELRLYVNQFYETLPGHPATNGSAGAAFYDASGDDLIFSNVNSRINGDLSLSNAVKLTEYTNIRDVNYFLLNYNNAKGSQADINQYVGEAHFFRAWYYYNLVREYGDVTWVNTVLSMDDESVLLERDKRTLVIDSVIADLDVAINLLSVQSNSSTMRIHKDVALAFKSRVALFEGTWQKYHKLKGDAFYTKDISDEKIREYLEKAKDAAGQVINEGRWKISQTGSPLTDYENLFITKDLTTNTEVMLWRKYDVAEGIIHGMSKYLSTGGGDIGLTLSLVDDYLTRDGKPFIGEYRKEIQKVYSKELMSDIRDPRLSQTVAVPGKQIKPNVLVAPFPPINQSGFNRNITGFPLYKYIEYDDIAATGEDANSSSPAIYFRYAEVLLNYAEALAELEENIDGIQTALKPLRDRAGMPGVDFNREYNIESDYPFRNLDKVLQSVRRERRIELAAEGLRLNDILRWAAADVLIVNKRPLGVLFIGSNIAEENQSNGFYGDALLYFDTPPSGKSVNFYLTGSPGDTFRYMDPYKKVLPQGFRFNLSRDYLLPIQERMIQLTDGKWKQNPGW